MGVKLQQNGFKGGMNYFNEDIDLSSDQYRLLINGRTRSGGIDPVFSATEVIGLPEGKRQFIAGFETLLVAVVSGSLYYKLNSSSTWNLIQANILNSSVDRIYGQAIPASSFNFGRNLADAAQVSGRLSLPVKDNSLVINSVSPYALLLQDGISQPWIVLADGTARVTSGYGSWNKDTNREYVPKGTLMTFLDGKLYILAPNKKDIYHSVTGRPIDFMINIMIDGSAGGNADTTSFNASNAEVTCLASLDQSNLFVGGALASFIVSPNYDIVIFNEPTFDISVVSAGVVNQESVQPLIGDYGFVDYDGMRSIKAIREEGNEGRNGDFSLNVAELFRGISQVAISVATITFDNYCIFSVNTTIGYLLLVFDRLLYKWVSVDILDGVPFKQFTVVSEGNNPTLYGITDTKLFKLYDKLSTRKSVQFYSGAFSDGQDLQNQVKTIGLRCIFFDSDAAYPAEAIEVADGSRGKGVIRALADRRAGVNYSVDYPVLWGSKSRVDNLYFNFAGVSNTAFKTSFIVKWDGPARLVRIQPEFDKKSYTNAIAQQASNYAAN